MADLNFIYQIAPIIQKEANERGYKICSAVIGQAICESNWGKSQLSARYFNFFGLKAGSAWIKAGKPVVNMKTMEEYTVGNLTQITDGFRVYSSMEEGVKGYYDFINTKRYANLKNCITPQQYLETIKADGYATSSTYVKTNMNFVNKYGLEKYDEHTASPVDYVINNVVSVNTHLNVRNRPVDGLIIGSLTNGQVVDIQGYQDGWYKIGNSHWVSANYIKSNTGTVMVNTSLNVREQPDKTSQVIGSFQKGDVIKLLNYKNNFYMTLTKQNTLGWCSADYVNII